MGFATATETGQAVKPTAEDASAQPDPKAGPDGAAPPLSLKDLLVVLRQGAPSRMLILAALLITLVEVACSLLFPFLTKQIVDRLSGGSSVVQDIFGQSSVYYLMAALLVGAVAGGVASFLLAKVGLAFTAKFKSRLTESLLFHSVTYFDGLESGAHVSRISTDIDVVSKFLTSHLQGLVLGLLMLVGSISMMAVLDGRLTLVIIVIIAAAFAVTAPVTIVLGSLTRSISDGNARLSARLARIFANVRLVKAYSSERYEIGQVDGLVGDLYRNHLHAARVQAALTPIMSLALTCSMLAIFAYGGARVETGSLSIGTLTAFILYIFSVVAPLIQLSMFFAGLQSAKGASARLTHILSGETEPSSEPADMSTAAIPDAAQALTFRDVLFSYDGCLEPALEIDSLVIPAGGSVAIVGPSGAGKTTVISLIERFYGPRSGAILWGDTDIADLPLRTWRSCIGYVSQDAPLLAGTIRENIEYGLSGEPDQARLERSAEAANCLGFIRELKDGFDSQVGDSGVRLSGGQRQRIAIARIFMRDAKLVILDEATSNLDVESEAAVLEAIKRLMRGRTTIVVTHRASGLANIENIAVLEKGRIVDFGAAGHIIGQSAYYSRLRETPSEAPAPAL
jgi:ATP-binding cassette subfamily B protein AbcA/BmrA